MRPIVFLLLVFVASLVWSADRQSMGEVFATDQRNQKVLAVEAALAMAQAQHGIIPNSAALEISRKADIRYASSADIAAEYKLVQHRMVALLNVWGRSMEGDAAQYVHYGATTVDIYDTVLVLQLLSASDILLARMRAFEAALLSLAEAHKDTVMIGRTLGQHALPITFGKKVSVWLGENRRHMERLQRVREDLTRSAILKGAVGSYLGLGEQAMAVEASFAAALGLPSPYVSDWHGTRDVFADYSQTLALMAMSNGRIGKELFLLQMTDINETVEVRRASAVGSSTMPHKNNPRRTEALVHYSRTIPRLAEVVLDDVQNYFERDNTSRPNRVLADISIEADAMYRTITPLIAELRVNPEAMTQNLNKTQGLIMSQRLAFALADKIGKTDANNRMHEIAKYAIQENLTLRQAFLASDLKDLIEGEDLDQLLDPVTYTGLARQQTEQVIQQIKEQREREGL